MTEAIIITAIIVGGLVAAFGIVVFAGFKAWKFEKLEAASRAATVEPGDIHVSVGNFDSDVAKSVAERLKRDYPQYLSAN